MNSMLKFAMFAAATALASCGLTSEELYAEYRDQCVEFGFTTGTDAFANCMKDLSLSAQQDSASRRALGAALLLKTTTPPTAVIESAPAYNPPAQIYAAPGGGYNVFSPTGNYRIPPPMSPPKVYQPY